MSRELVKILRGIADIAEDNDKPNWANAMRQAAEYIRADLDKPLTEPFTYIVPSAFEKLRSGYAMSVFCTKQAINKSDIPLYAEPLANKPLSDDEPQVINLLTESTQSSAKKYFSYDPYDGFELYDTEDEAKAATQRVLDIEREEAREGWSEDVDKICWGEVRQHVVETMRRPRTDADHVDSEFYTIVDYGLVDVGVQE
jgi:hypothetical protein